MYNNCMNYNYKEIFEAEQNLRQFVNMIQSQRQTTEESTLNILPEMQNTLKDSIIKVLSNLEQLRKFTDDSSSRREELASRREELAERKNTKMNKKNLPQSDLNREGEKKQFLPSLDHNAYLINLAQL